MISKTNNPTKVSIKPIPEDEEYVAGWVWLNYKKGCMIGSVEFPEDRLVELREALNDYLGVNDATEAPGQEGN